MSVRSPHGVLVPGGGGPSALEPALKHRFELQFQRMGPITSGWDARQIWAVRTFSPGGSQIEAGTAQLLNQQIRYPRNLSAGDAAELELVLLTGSTALHTMMRWHHAVGKRDASTGGSVGLLRPGGGIGGDAYVYALGPDGERQIGGWFLGDIWPCSIIAGTFDQSSECEPLTHRVRFEVNRIEMLGEGGTLIQ